MLPGRENTLNSSKPLTRACKLDYYNHVSIVARCYGNREEGKHNASGVTAGFVEWWAGGRHCFSWGGDTNLGRDIAGRESL